MNRMRRCRYSALAGCMVSLLAVGADFTWTGGGNAPAWDNPANWGEMSNYPDGTDDDATFPDNNATAWECYLVDEEIGDLTIEESVGFDAESGTPVLQISGVLTIDASEQAVTVTISADAQIATCPID